MKSAQKAVHSPKGTRELSDRELNEITRAVGDRARAQTIDQKERMKADLLKQLAATRAAFRTQGKKGA